MLELENKEVTHKCELEMKRIEMEVAAVVARVVGPEPKAESVQASFLNYLRFRMIAMKLKLTVIYSDLKGSW